MFQLRWLTTVFTLTTLATTTTFMTDAIQSTAIAGYRPINPTRPIVRTGSTATRGGCEGGDPANLGIPALTTLAPRAHIGKTSTTHPTLVWYVAEQLSYPIEINLFDYGDKGRGQLLQTFKLASTPGLMQWTLPKDQPGLTVGKTYLWQVALICNAVRPSRNPWMEAVFTVVNPAVALKTALAQQSDPIQRATLYAQADLWYDALAETFNSPSATPYRRTLLQDLTQQESPDQRSQLEAIMTRDRL